MAATHIFSGGIPTDPDVKKLMTALGTIQPGLIVRHDDIEGILKLKRGTPRYRTVVAAWRRRMFNEQNIDMDAISGLGFRVLKPFERVTSSTRDFRQGVRKIGKSVRRIVAAPLEELSTREQATVENVQRRMQATLATAQADRKAIAVRLGPVRSHLRDGAEED